MALSRSFQPGRVCCCSGSKYGCVPHEIVTKWFLMSLLMPQKAAIYCMYEQISILFSFPLPVCNARPIDIYLILYNISIYNMCSYA